jgi:hypothetical protein
MSKNLWDEDDEGAEFLDRPDETRLDNDRQPMQAPPVRVQIQTQNPAPQPRSSNVPAEPTRVNPTAQQQVQETYREPEELLEEEDFTSVLSDANLRIAQGSLYQMIMNHNLFEGMDADPKAIENVQKEIRKFARERMEIMLGMRKETTTVERLDIDFPFNALEVDILKKLAFTATKGATEHSDNYVPEVRRVTEEVENVPRRTTLNPISKPSNQRRVAPQQPQKQTSLPSKAQAPMKRSKMDITIDQICAEEGVPRELLEEHYKPLGKLPEQLSEQELANRAKETARRLASRTTVKSSSALPMASPEQQEALAMARANQVSQGPGMAAILDKVSKMPKSLNVE